MTFLFFSSILFAFIPVYSMSPDPWGISMTMKLEVQKMSFLFLSSIIFPFMIVNVSWSVGHQNIRMIYENRKYDICPLSFSQRLFLL
jgi:hypothetical protein